MSRVFTQKQIKALINAMWQDETRPALTSLAFKDHALVVTDGFILIAMNITEDWKSEYRGDEFGDYEVPKQALKEWCKTHTSKAEISVEELWNMATQKHPYPEWTKLADIEPEDKTIRSGIMPQPIFNMTLVKAIADVFLDEPMTVGIYGENTPAKLINDKGDVALIMPIGK